MKTRFFFLLLISCFGIVQAQSQNEECGRIATSVDSLVKANDYENAYKTWLLCSDYPLETLYKNGEKILLHQLELPNSEESRKEFLSLLQQNYINYDKKIPGNKNGNLVKRAMALHDYKTGTADETYALLDKAFKEDRDNFTDANALYLYFEMFYGKFKSGDKTITEDAVFARQDEIDARLRQLSDDFPAMGKDYATAERGIKALTGPISSCEKRTAFYGKNFETQKKDTAWLQQALDNLSENKCTSSPLYLNIATELYALRPDGYSAYALGIATIRSKNREKGIEYLNTAATLETDVDKKAQVYYTLATMSGTDRTKSYDYLKKALAAQPSFGKAYLMLSQLYAGSDCGETPFEKKAIYFLAAETAKKAGVADPFLKKASAGQVELYLKKVPSKQEIKAAKKAGKKVTFGCGINESVIIPD